MRLVENGSSKVERQGGKSETEEKKTFDELEH